MNFFQISRVNLKANHRESSKSSSVVKKDHFGTLFIDFLWVNNSEPYGRSDIRSEIAKKSSELIAARDELTGNKNRFLIKLNYLVLRRQNATQQRIIQDQRTEIAAAARRCNDLQIYLSEKVQ